MKLPIFFAFPALLLALLLPSCGDSSDSAQTVAFVTNGSARFWVIAKRGAEDAGKEFGVKVDVRFPDGIADQKRVVEDLVVRGVGGIAISPIDPTNQIGLIDKAAKQTKVITHDSDAPGSKRLCYVGMVNYDAGRMAGRLVKEAIPDGGKIMVFVGRLEQDNAKGRRQGLIDELLGRSHNVDRYDPPGKVLKNDKYTILDTLTDQFDRVKAKGNAEDAITRHPDLACMVGLFEYNPPLCLQALEQADKLGQIKVVGFDEADETLQGIVDGHVHATVAQNPYRYGWESVRILAGLLKGDDSVLPEGGFLDIAARGIGPDEVEEFRSDLQRKLGKE